MKVLLLWHNSHSNNLGVSALTYAQLEIIHDALKGEKNVYSVESYGTPQYNSRTKSTTIKHHRYSLKCILKGVVSKKYRSADALWSGKYDFIIDIGEGDSFTDIYGFKRFFALWLTKVIVINRNIPLIIAPQTIGPFRNKFTIIFSDS